MNLIQQLQWSLGKQHALLHPQHNLCCTSPYLNEQVKMVEWVNDRQTLRSSTYQGWHDGKQCCFQVKASHWCEDLCRCQKGATHTAIRLVSTGVTHLSMCTLWWHASTCLLLATWYAWWSNMFCLIDGMGPSNPEWWKYCTNLMQSAPHKNTPIFQQLLWLQIATGYQQYFQINIITSQKYSQREYLCDASGLVHPYILILPYTCKGRPSIGQLVQVPYCWIDEYPKNTYHLW